MFHEMCGKKWPLDHFRLAFWNNPTDDQSLSLTLYGYNFLVKELKLKSYTYEVQEPLTNGNILQMERYFPSMYFMFGKRKKITVFEEQEATMLSLYSGDLQAYLRSLESQ